MFGFILFIVVLSFVGRLFTRPFYGYRRPRTFYYPFGGFGGWGMGRYHHHHHGPMGCGPHHYHHHMGYGRRW